VNRLGDLKPLARFCGRAWAPPQLRDMRQRPWHRERVAQFAANRRRSAQIELLLRLLATGADDDAIVDALLAGASALPWRVAA
jgi:hypothetical protein